MKAPQKMVFFYALLMSCFLTNASDSVLTRHECKPLTLFLLITLRFGQQQYGREYTRRFQEIDGLSYVFNLVNKLEVKLSASDDRDVAFKKLVDDLKEVNRRCIGIETAAHDAIHTKWHDSVYIKDDKYRLRSSTVMLESLYPVGRLIYKYTRRKNTLDQQDRYRSLLTPLLAGPDARALIYNALRGPVTVPKGSFLIPLLHAVEKNLIEERKNKKNQKNEESI